MVWKEEYHLLKENLERKISAKTDSSRYLDNKTTYLGEDDSLMYGIYQSYFKYKGNNGPGEP